jgi:hypothetical protein
MGEAANFAAYSFAPAILVTPLGAGSVFISAILASFFLNEHLTSIFSSCLILLDEGKIGCSLCILGSIIIILHAPEEEDIQSVEKILEYAIRPGFLLYMVLVGVISLYLIYQVAPVYGKKHMLVYVTICSLVGSISVMACKGFGIAIKLSIAGQNQCILIFINASYLPIHLYFWHHCYNLRIDSNQLLQQGIRLVFYNTSDTHLLCHVYNSYYISLCHFV